MRGNYVPAILMALVFVIFVLLGYLSFIQGAVRGRHQQRIAISEMYSRLDLAKVLQAELALYEEQVSQLKQRIEASQVPVTQAALAEQLGQIFQQAGMVVESLSPSANGEVVVNVRGNYDSLVNVLRDMYQQGSLLKPMKIMISLDKTNLGATFHVVFK